MTIWINAAGQTKNQYLSPGPGWTKKKPAYQSSPSYDSSSVDTLAAVVVASTYYDSSPSYDSSSSSSDYSGGGGDYGGGGASSDY